MLVSVSHRGQNPRVLTNAQNQEGSQGVHRPEVAGANRVRQNCVRIPVKEGYEWIWCECRHHLPRYREPTAGRKNGQEHNSTSPLGLSNISEG